MPTFIPSATVTAATPPTAAQAGARGRPAGDDDARSFGAVLERSRAGARRSQDDSETSEAGAAGTPQKPGRGPARKDEPGSELLTIALFTPQIQAHAPAAAAAAAARTGAAKAVPTAALPATTDASLAGPATATAPAAGTGADGAADALPTTAEPAAAEAKAQPAGTSTAATQAAASAERADPVPTLPPTTQAAAKTDAATPPAPTLAATVPPAGTQASGGAQAGASGAATASTRPTTTAQIQAGPDAARAPEADAPALPAAAALAQQADAQSAATPTVPPSTSALQPALDRAPPTTSSAPAHAIAPPVDSPEWAPALGHQMLRMRAGGQQVAELSLNPAGLGPLKITLGVGDNQVQAMFVSAHESVRKAVEAALPQLRSTLAEQGISLGQTSVGAESRPWAGMGSGFAQQQEQRQPSSGHASAYPGAARGADAPATPLPTRAAAPSRTSGVDTFA